ncbi:MAG: hypothetical protein ACT6FG_00450 [Methanosarcinaceae archaeon]
MKSIKFDREFMKFPAGLFSGDEVRLLEVLKTRYENLHSGFVEYDTEGVSSRYKLPESGDALVLILIYGTELFTTIKQYTPVKEYEYNAARGHNLTVEIGDD